MKKSETTEEKDQVLNSYFKDNLELLNLIGDLVFNLELKLILNNVSKGVKNDKSI